MVLFCVLVPSLWWENYNTQQSGSEFGLNLSLVKRRVQLVTSISLPLKLTTLSEWKNIYEVCEWITMACMVFLYKQVTIKRWSHCDFILQDTVDHAAGLLLEMPPIHTVICTVLRYVPPSKTVCELHSVPVVAVIVCTNKYKNICGHKIFRREKLYILMTAFICCTKK